MLLSTLVMPLALAFSKTYAAGPVFKGPLFVKEFESARDWDLEEMQSKKLSGWAAESEAVKAKYLKLAQQYAQYRRGVNKAGFQDECAKDPHIFCTVEKERLAKRTALQEQKATRGSVSRAAFNELVRKADPREFATLDRAQIVRGLGFFNSLVAVDPLIEKVLGKRDCSQAPLAAALASKLEEFFPDATRLDQAQRLYLQAGECKDDESTYVVARFRAALLSIWKNDCSAVEELLSPIVNYAEQDGYHSRTRFWRHYCASQVKDSSLAQKLADELWNNHPMTLQNLLVNGEAARVTAFVDGKEKPQVQFRSVLNPELNGLALAVEALVEMKMEEQASEVIDAMSSKLVKSESGFRLYLAGLVNHFESALARFKILALLFRDQPRLITGRTLKMYYPLTHFSVIEGPKQELDPYLVISLIRQESAFNSRAMSSAGARGLMQVMPSTARHLGNRSKQALFDPKTNIKFGTKYLARRLQNFSGDVELTLAAYNAGFSRVDGWLKRYPAENRLLFLDLIPFRETRDYVASILRNYYWYVQLYSKEPLKTRLAKQAKAPTVPIRFVSLEDSLSTSVQAR